MPLNADPLPPAAPASRTRLSVVAPPGRGLGADAMELPCEHALLLRVALPLATHRARCAAVGFAVEDLIAAPLDAVHVALGPELAPGEYLVAVVARAVMDDFAPRAQAAGLRLAPDALGLPVPPAGGWSVRETGGRLLARRADGTGFAVRAEAFETFWRAEAAPQILLYGGRLPEGVPAGATGLTPAAAAPETLGFDLLQGAYARRSGGGRRVAVRFGAIAALALAAHGAILGAETVALRRIATEREGALRAELAARLPDLPAGVPLDVALRRALPEAAGAGGGFLPLLAEVSTALEPFAGEVVLRNLGYGAREDSLAVLIEAVDLAALQQIERALAAAGFGVAAGVATTGAGAAEVRYVIGRAGG